MRRIVDRARPSCVGLGSAVVDPPPESQTTNSRLTRRSCAFPPCSCRTSPKNHDVLAAAAAVAAALVLASSSIARSFGRSLYLSFSRMREPSRPFSLRLLFLCCPNLAPSGKIALGSLALVRARSRAASRLGRSGPTLVGGARLSLVRAGQRFSPRTRIYRASSD